MTQRTQRPLPSEKVVLWDDSTGAPPRALLEGAVVCLGLDRGLSVAHQGAQARQVLEMHPWAVVIASGRWVPLFISLAVRNLHLCLRSAILHAPSTMLQRGGERLALPLEPLAFPSVVVNANPRHLARMVEAWGSLTVTPDEAPDVLQGLIRGLSLMESPAHSKSVRGI